MPICSPCARSCDCGLTRAALTLPINQSHFTEHRFIFPLVNSTTGCLQVSVFSTRRAPSHVGHWLECSKWVTEWRQCFFVVVVVLLIIFKVSSVIFVYTFASELNAFSLITRATATVFGSPDKRKEQINTMEDYSLWLYSIFLMRISCGTNGNRSKWLCWWLKLSAKLANPLACVWWITYFIPASWWSDLVRKHWKSLGIGKKDICSNVAAWTFTKVHVSPASQGKTRLIPSLEETL